MIELSLLVKKTIEYLKQKNINELDLSESSRNPLSCWGEICVSCKGYYEFKEAQYIKAVWEKNCKSFKDKVFEIMNEPDKNLIKRLEIDLKTSIEIKKNILSKPRYYIRKPFIANLLSKKLQEYSINCWFTCIYNWFNSGKISNWKGRFICISKECMFEAKFKLGSNFDQPIIFYLTWVRHEEHNKSLKPKPRITGERRKYIAEKLILHGTDNFLIKDFCDETNQLDKVKNSSLRVLKSQFIHKNRISNDTCIDAQAAKNVFDTSCHIENENSLKGFIQEVSQIPFGCIMISEIQICIWNLINKRNPIIFFDATGGLLKSIKCQNKPLLYSLAMHDNVTETIIPLAEFFTTSQTSSSIRKNLDTIRDILKVNKSEYPEIIVTDFSWAIINAVLDSFNRGDISDYLNWSFDKIVKKSKNFQNRSLIYLCATHFLKLINVDIRKLNDKINSSVVKTFLFCVSLLQNTTSLKDFERILIETFNLFNQRYLTVSVLVSLKKLREEVINRNLNTLLNILSNDDEFSLYKSSVLKKIDNENEIILNTKNLKNNSPFSRYFHILLGDLEKTIETDTKKIGSSLNKYYNPNLFYLIKKRLYIMPLWSGVLIGERLFLFNILKTRLTNNPVESWFGKLKNNLLKLFQNNGVAKPMLSEYTAVIYEKLKYIYLNKYQKELFEKKIIKAKKIVEAKENWKKNQSNFKRKKGFYYTNDNLFGYIDKEYEMMISKISSLDFQNSFIDQFGNDDFDEEMLSNRDLSRFSEQNDYDSLSLNFGSSFDSESTIEQTSINQKDSDSDDIYNYFGKVKSTSSIEISSNKEITDILNFSNKKISDKISEDDVFWKKSETFCQDNLNINEYYSFEKGYGDNIHEMIEEEYLNKSYFYLEKNFERNKIFFTNFINFLTVKNYLVYENDPLEDSFNDIVLVNNLKFKALPIKVKGDGNCLYNSFSYLFFRNENYSKLLRIIVSYVFYVYKQEFEHILSEKEPLLSFKNLIEKNTRNGEWANEYCLLAICLIFKKPIYCYSISNYKPVSYKISQKKEKNWDQSPILIGFKNDHFVPLILLNKNDTIEMPYMVQFEEYEFLEKLI